MGRGRGIGFLALLLLTPLAASAQGWVEPPGVDRSGFVVDKVRSDVRVRVDGRVARVEVSEWFRNAGGRVAEGHYLYPLPGEAVFEGFSLFQGDNELRGEIMDARQARGIYEEIVRRRADPALIELAGQGLLRAKLFPIAPGEERKVTLRFTQVLTRAGDALQFQYAGAVPGTSVSRAVHDRISGPRAELVAASGPVRGSFQVVVEDGSSFQDPFSPTHTLDVSREGGRLTARLDGEIEGRLSLFFPLARNAVGVSVVAHRPAGEEGYFMLTLTPGRPSGATQPRDVTVVLDVSGSMSGEKIGQAKAALHDLLGTLERSDRFRLVAFSNAVRVMDTEWSRATLARLDEAGSWVDRLVADGGTNIGAALDEAFRLESPGDRLPIVIFLTDGLPSVGEQSPERLADRAEGGAGRARIFAFGVGHDVNTHLLDRLGEAGRGSTEYVEPGENVERAMALLSTKIRHPVLTDLEIAGAPVRLEEIYPVHIPDVFAGEELVLFGRYQGSGEGRLRIRGSRSGDGEEFAAQASFPARTDANAFIPRLWASRKLGHLTRQIWTEGETPDLVEEIRTLALRYGLPSPFTSYLVQEPDVVAGLRRDVVPAPAGSGSAGRVGRTSIQPQSAMAPVSTGKQAVQAAEEARFLREAKTTDALSVADMELEERLRAGGAGNVLAVAGRVFRVDQGVWKDVAYDEATPVARVQAYSAAYFALLKALPELAPVLSRTGQVIVAGAELSVQVGDQGVTELDAAALDHLVKRFRGQSPKP